MKILKDGILYLLVIASLFCTAKAEKRKGIYYLSGTVTEVNAELVTVSAEDGNLWQFFASDMEVGENVQLKMYGNFTRTVSDDSVIDAE